MELKHIKELMAAMGRSGMKEVVIEEKDFKLTLVREGEEQVQIIDSSRDYYLGEQSRADLAFAKGGSVSTTPPARPVAHQEPVVVQEKEQPARKEESTVPSKFVKSPMVGTFYTAGSPDDAPFIKPGDKIEENTVVCIIEAMKVMNEIKAGVSGTVSEVLMENGHPVEFGTSLFKIV